MFSLMFRLNDAYIWHRERKIVIYLNLYTLQKDKAMCCSKTKLRTMKVCASIAMKIVWNLNGYEFKYLKQ